MYCPRFDHFRRIMPNGKISLCGHMVGQPEYNSLSELETSIWLSKLKDNNDWSNECKRCQQEEALGQKSIRQHAIERDKLLKFYDKDYLIVGGVLDNICNSACQFCSEELSTKIGSLKFGKNYKLINNIEKFYSLPQERILELDINGGEPSNSPNYQAVLENLPPNLQILRINTNASKVIDNLKYILDKKIKVYITISLDGTKNIFEYARFPLKWDNFINVIDKYIELRNNYNFLSLNFWTTLSAYTINDLPNIEVFAKSKKIDLSWGFLQNPNPLNIVYTNFLTSAAKEKIKFTNTNLYNLIASKEDNSEHLLEYIKSQDKIRGTNYEDCYNWT